MDVSLNEEYLDEQDVEQIFDEVLGLENLKFTLDQGFFWQFLVIIFENLQHVYSLNDYFTLKFKQMVASLATDPTQNYPETQIFQVLSSSTGCLSVVLDHELKKFYVSFISQNVLPMFTQLAESHFETFVSYLTLTVQQILTSDQKYVLGLNKILAAISGSENFTDKGSEVHILTKIISLLETNCNLNDETNSENFNFNAYLRLNDSLLSAVHRNNYKLESTKKYALEQLSIFKDNKISSNSSFSEIARYLIDLNRAFSFSNNNKEVDMPSEVIKDQLFNLLNIGDSETPFDAEKSIPENFSEYSNALISVFFRFVNNLIETQQLELIADKIPQIEALYKFGLQKTKEKKNFSIELLAVLLEFLRKVVSVLEMFSNEFESSIMNTVFTISLEKV